MTTYYLAKRRLASFLCCLLGHRWHSVPHSLPYSFCSRCHCYRLEEAACSLPKSL